MQSRFARFLLVLLENFDVIAGPLISLAYPLYASIKAIETKSHVDDKQWLTYWVLYSMITLFELTFAKLLEWIPIWPVVKLILTSWLVLPHFNGAAFVYENYVRPLVVDPQKTVNRWYVPKKEETSSRPDNILTASEKFYDDNDTVFFDNQLNHRMDKFENTGYLAQNYIY